MKLKTDVGLSLWFISIRVQIQMRKKRGKAETSSKRDACAFMSHELQGLGVAVSSITGVHERTGMYVHYRQ